MKSGVIDVMDVGLGIRDHIETVKDICEMASGVKSA